MVLVDRCLNTHFGHKDPRHDPTLEAHLHGHPARESNSVTSFPKLTAAMARLRTGRDNASLSGGRFQRHWRDVQELSSATSSHAMGQQRKDANQKSQAQQEFPNQTIPNVRLQNHVLHSAESPLQDRSADTSNHRDQDQITRNFVNKTDGARSQA